MFECAYENWQIMIGINLAWSICVCVRCVVDVWFVLVGGWEDDQDENIMKVNSWSKMGKMICQCVKVCIDEWRTVRNGLHNQVNERSSSNSNEREESQMGN